MSEGSGYWWLTLIVGWSLGLFSPHITGWITRRSRRKRLLRAIAVELSELRVSLAQAAWTLRTKTGSLDKTFAKWYCSAIADTKDPLWGPTVRAIAERLAGKSDEDVDTYLATAINRSQDRGEALNLQKYETPFLQSSITEFHLFEPYLQVSLFKVRWHLGGDVPAAVEFGRVAAAPVNTLRQQTHRCQEISVCF